MGRSLWPADSNRGMVGWAVAKGSGRLKRLRDAAVPVVSGSGIAEELDCGSTAGDGRGPHRGVFGRC